mgnify:FL=1
MIVLKQLCEIVFLMKSLFQIAHSLYSYIGNKLKSSSYTVNYMIRFNNIFLSLICLIGTSFSSYSQYIPPDIEEMRQLHETNALKNRIPAPDGFKTVETPYHSFQNHLQNLLLKPEGSKVKYYDGRTKPAEGVYVAVVHGPIDNKDLHQCADAIIRLKAEFLYLLGRYDKINFNFTNGFNAEFSQWIQGKRIQVEGNRCKWVQSTTPSHNFNVFSQYLEIVYMYAGTRSLEKELVPTDIASIEIGDILIQGGSPGHAIIVVNKAINPENNETAVCFAQSYMPAQELQILVNPESDNSPWYFMDKNTTTIQTPEWTFKARDLKKFPE